MKKKLLIVTPNKSFGDLLKTNLEMSEFYTELVYSSDAALGIKDINLVILDADINDPSMEFLFTRLLEKEPGMGILVIHSLDQSIELSVRPETSYKAISRPFDFPTLLLAIQEILKPEAFPETGSETGTDDKQDVISIDEISQPAAAWFDDPAIVRERLKTSIFSPLIREAVLISSNQILGLTWDADEQTILALQETIHHHLNWINKNSLIKNFRIGDVEYILHTTPLSAVAGILGIFFDPAIKFSQASVMTRIYAARILQEQTNPYLPGGFIDDQNVQAGIPTGTQQLFIPKTMESTLDSNQNPGVILNQVEQSTPYHSSVPGLVTLEGEHQSQSKESTRPDTQSGEGIPQQWIPEMIQSSATSTHEQEIVYPWEVNQRAASSSGNNPILKPDYAGANAISTGNFPDGNITEAFDSNVRDLPSFEDTQPVDLKYKSELDIPPVNPSIAPINPAEMVEYSFLMISNNPEIRMVGDIEEIVGEEILDICQENGWNLLILIVHSDYLQITIGVPSTMPPGVIIRIFREKTTKRIIESFEEIDANIVSGDFWVKGYLVTNGTETEI